MFEDQLLAILLDQRVILPFQPCRLVCKNWRGAIDASQEFVKIDKMHNGASLGEYLSKLKNLKSLHFDRQFRKIHLSEVIDSNRKTYPNNCIASPPSDKDEKGMKKAPATLREREDEKIQFAFKALSVCHAKEIAFTFCRLSAQDLDALLRALAHQVSISFLPFTGPHNLNTRSTALSPQLPAVSRLWI
jgi:hypothetical protein